MMMMMIIEMRVGWEVKVGIMATGNGNSPLVGMSGFGEIPKAKKSKRLTCGQYLVLHEDRIMRLPLV